MYLLLWIRKTSFPVVEYKYDSWFYSWLKCYNGIFISVRLRISYLYVSSFLEIQGICKSNIVANMASHAISSEFDFGDS
jgi:hypothetical protein